MKTLSTSKRRVIELMTLGGYSVKDAAREAGVNPSTVAHWRKDDPEFRSQMEAWENGPAADPVTIAQSRRIIIDELARRILHNRSDLTVRELLNIHGRIIREQSKSKTEDNHDDNIEHIELSDEEAEQLWEEIRREKERPSESQTDEPTEPGALH